MRKFKIKKFIKGLILGIGLMALTLFVVFTVFIWLVVTGGPAKKTTNLNKYQDIFQWSGMSGMMILPEEVPKDVVDTDFYYYYRDTLFSPTYQIYFQCTYEPEAYQKEIARLEGVRKVYGGTEKKLLRDEENKYHYPAYIAIENHHSQYEYALITGKHQITYIITAYINEEDVVFDQKYLPLDYMTEIGKDFTSGYCMYSSYISEELISYDNTRNETAEVVDVHAEQIQDSVFFVRTVLDENNREIIQECSFDYYENLEDEQCDSTIYSDINGMEYRDLKLNKDRTKAVVVYKDGDEEKEFVVELPFPKGEKE